MILLTLTRRDRWDGERKHPVTLRLGSKSMESYRGTSPLPLLSTCCLLNTRDAEINDLSSSNLFNFGKTKM